MAFDDELRRAVDTLSERLLDGHRQAVDEAVAAVRADSRTVDLSASQRLVDAVRAIDAGRTLTDILGTLVTCAAREASRVGVLLVRGEIVCGWRVIGFAGFGPSFPGDDNTRTIEMRHDAGGVITEALRSGAPASSDSAAPAFADLPHGLESFAVPLIMGGQIIAVLYADHGAGELWTGTLEVLARHAARCLEALTAATAARALTERPEMPPIARHDDPDHADEAVAQRYARLLVSEIKLYHGAAVMAGIQEGDLATRLGGEIAHARSLYDQRVAPALQERTDYFHTELVRTLANGDAALLEVKT